MKKRAEREAPRKGDADNREDRGREKISEPPNVRERRARAKKNLWLSEWPPILPDETE